MWIEIILFLCGAIIGHLIPRIPWLVLPRFRAWNQQFPPHPEPIPVDGYLIQRVLNMRSFNRLSIVFAMIPLGFGLGSLAYGSLGLGLGMWMTSCWTLLARVVGLLDKGSLWGIEMAQELQLVRNCSESEDRCCNSAMPVWQVMAVRCSACNAILLSRARPDLGRPRCDGFVKGTLRLILSEGQPLARSASVEHIGKALK
jgi:hypothetical protein